MAKFNINNMGELEDDSGDLNINFSELPAFTSLKQLYLPAADFSDATLTPTTDDLAREIRRHSGIEISRLQMHDWLHEVGFKCKPLGMRFVWLLKTHADAGFDD